MRFRWMSLCLMTALILAIGFVGAQGVQEPAPSVDQPSVDQQRAREANARGEANRFAGAELERIRRGFEIAPVPLDLEGRNRALVGLGSYLVNVAGGCNDCHTNPPYAAGGDPFKGEPKRINAEHYLGGGMSFGPFVSRNLTPDADTGRLEWTFEEFERTMRTGMDLENAHPQVSPLLQVMPWPVYQDLSDRDLRAMYEYLSAIPHAEPGTTP